MLAPRKSILCGEDGMPVRLRRARAGRSSLPARRSSARGEGHCPVPLRLKVDGPKDRAAVAALPWRHGSAPLRPAPPRCSTPRGSARAPHFVGAPPRPTGPSARPARRGCCPHARRLAGGGGGARGDLARTWPAGSDTPHRGFQQASSRPLAALAALAASGPAGWGPA